MRNPLIDGKMGYCMDLTTLGIIIMIMLLVFLFSGMPVAFALGVPSLVFGFLLLEPAHLNFTAHMIFDGVDDFALLAVPLFILMGSIIAVTPCGSDLYEGVNRWLFKLPGGLAISNVVACAIFSCLCGSSPATAAAIGSMGIPEMRKRGYPDSLATGSIVGGGALGNLIPPGMIPIIYGIITETSIGKLYIGSIIPGIIITGMMCIWVFIYSHWRRRVSRRLMDIKTDNLTEFYKDISYTWKERMEGILKVLPFLSLIVLLLYVLFGGYATPSEAAGVASIATFLLAVVIYRIKSFKVFRDIMEMTIKETTMIMLIVAISFLFSTLIIKLHITQSVVSDLIGLNLTRWILMLMTNLFLLVLGCLLPPVAILLVTCPILVPVIRAYGFDPVWFGIIMTINMEVAMITPPFGFNLFVVKGIAPDIPLQTILKGSAPFAVCLLIGIVLCSIWPELITWLPSYMIR